MPKVYPYDITSRIPFTTDEEARQSNYEVVRGGRFYKRIGIDDEIKASRRRAENSVDSKYLRKYGRSYKRLMTKSERKERDTKIMDAMVKDLRAHGYPVGKQKVVRLDMKRANDRRYLQGQLRTSETTRQPLGYTIHVRHIPHERAILRTRYQWVRSGNIYKQKKKKIQAFETERYYEDRSEVEIVYIEGYIQPRIQKTSVIYIHWHYHDQHIYARVTFDCIFGALWRAGLEERIEQAFEDDEGGRLSDVEELMEHVGTPPFEMENWEFDRAGDVEI